MFDKLYEKLSTMEVKRPYPAVLTISKSRGLRIAQLFSDLFFLGIFYKRFPPFSSLDNIKQLPSKILDSPGVSILLLVFIFLVLRTLGNLKRIIEGENFTFDGLRQALFKGDQQIASFAEINEVHIKTPYFHDMLRYSPYRLFVILKTGKAIRVAGGSDNEEGSKVANEIASLINVEMVETDGFVF